MLDLIAEYERKTGQSYYPKTTKPLVKESYSVHMERDPLSCTSASKTDLDLHKKFATEEEAKDWLKAQVEATPEDVVIVGARITHIIPTPDGMDEAGRETKNYYKIDW